MWSVISLLCLAVAIQANIYTSPWDELVPWYPEPSIPCWWSQGYEPYRRPWRRQAPEASMPLVSPGPTASAIPEGQLESIPELVVDQNTVSQTRAGGTADKLALLLKLYLTNLFNPMHQRVMSAFLSSKCANMDPTEMAMLDASVKQAIKDVFKI